MTSEHGSVRVYLGDGRTAPQHARLLAILRRTITDQGWREVEAGPAERVLELGEAQRWVTLEDSLQLAAPDEHERLCSDLSREFCLVSLSCSPAADGVGARIVFELFKEGAKVDRVVLGAAARAVGNPAQWSDLLGSRRNAARLELAWAGAADVAEAWAATAEIVGFDGGEALRLLRADRAVEKGLEGEQQGRSVLCFRRR